eukprot:5529055-Prymnesium_polylepis.1
MGRGGAPIAGEEATKVRDDVRIGAEQAAVREGGRRQLDDGEVVARVERDDDGRVEVEHGREEQRVLRVASEQQVAQQLLDGRDHAPHRLLQQLAPRAVGGPVPEPAANHVAEGRHELGEAARGQRGDARRVERDVGPRRERQPAEQRHRTPPVRQVGVAAARAQWGIGIDGVRLRAGRAQRDEVRLEPRDGGGVALIDEDRKARRDQQGLRAQPRAAVGVGRVAVETRRQQRRA